MSAAEQSPEIDARLTNAERELLRPALARYARWGSAHDGPVFEVVEQIMQARLADFAEAIWWPQGDLLERRAIFVYEGARMRAAAVGAPIIPEPWPRRDEPFRAQFLNVIAMMCGPDRKASPEELHDDCRGASPSPRRPSPSVLIPLLGCQVAERDHVWMGLDLRVSDLAVFVALCELARKWVIEYPEGECGSCGETPEHECAESKRFCGHHCNHSWEQDVCHWCGAEFGEDEQSTPPGQAVQ